MTKTDHDYIKALSTHNIAEMVYARQVFSGPGMPQGLCLCRMYDNIEVVPDHGWIVWYDHGEPLYDIMTDEEFRSRFVPYEQLPQNLRAVWDAHPGYDEWVEIMNIRYDAQEPAP